MRAMPTACQGRSKATEQRCLSSGLFRARLSTHPCSVAHRVSAETQISEPLFALFLNAFGGIVTEEQTR